jgi:hypothetical protein
VGWLVDPWNVKSAAQHDNNVELREDDATQYGTLKF